MDGPEGAYELSEDHQRLIQRYNKLRARYTELTDKYEYCKHQIRRAKGKIDRANEKILRANEREKQVNEKYAAAKESARSWKDYLEKYGLIAAEHPVSTEQPEQSSRPSPNKSDLKRVTSSQTTEGDPNDVVPIDALVANQDDNDEPEIISARMVKRRRRDGPAPAPKIKLEPASQSNPVMLVEPSSPGRPHPQPARKETSDLDANLEPLRTPRKRKSGRAWSEEAHRPPLLQAATSSLSEGDLRGLDELKNEDPTGHSEFHRSLDEGPAHQTLDAAGHDRALQPRSVNITSPPRRTSLELMQRKRKYDSTKYRIVSEDGDEETSQVATTTAKVHKEASSDRRLSDLLSEGAIGERSPLPKRHAGRPRPVQRPSPAAATPASHQLIGAKPSGRPSKRSNRPFGIEPSPPPGDPADEPLRSRKPGTLNLSDFKINPNYLGSTFAYADPIRGRDARRCLPGCTRPECCGGEFRKMAEIAGLPSKTDAEALEDYLGPEFAALMGAYGPDQRKEILIQARATALANQFGKHRHAFERRSTPPGFWRTDMPTTQEEEADREEARRMEREKVEERYRVAMRGGGRWIFRDE